MNESTEQDITMILEAASAGGEEEARQVFESHSLTERFDEIKKTL